MTMTETGSPTAEGFKEAAFNILNLEDEIRADQLLADLLRHFFQYQVEKIGEEPETAGLQARGADYFLREYIIGDCRENIYLTSPERIRQFAGNWYIVRNLEPNMAELGDILEGVAAFYVFVQSCGRISQAACDSIKRTCSDLDYYQQRIDSFWAIDGDGYLAWNKACPLVGN